MAGIYAENHKGQFVTFDELTPSEAEELIVDKGNWCKNCQYLEGFDDLRDDGTCGGCGCVDDDHITVAVVEVRK